MSAWICFIVLCIAFVAGPLLIVIGGAHAIREDERNHRTIIES